MASKRIVGRPLLVFFLIASSMLALTSWPVVGAAYFALFLSLVVLNPLKTLYSTTFANTFPLILFAILPLSLINFFTYGEYRYFLYASFFPIGFLIALLLREEPALLRKGLLVSIGILQTILLAQLFINNFTPGYSYETIAEGVSSNGFTTILLLLLSFYLINSMSWSFYDFAISAFSLFLCIFGYGRGSIAAAALVLLAFPIQLLGKTQPELIFKMRINRRLLLISVSSLILFIIIRSIDVTLLVETFTKIRIDNVSENGFMSTLRDDSREAILLDYLKNLDIFSFFFGNDSPSLFFHKNLMGNPHSSIINTHRLFGFFYISASILLLAKLNRSYNLADVPPEKYLLIIAILFRIFSEPFLLGSPLDVLLFSAIATEPKKLIECRGSQTLEG